MTCTCGYSQLAADVVATLTPRERDVLGLVTKGFTNRQVGERLGMGERAVIQHMNSGMDKLGVDNRVQAAVLATKAGLA